jgi:nitrous oxide reductase accessory protein NosL
LARKRIMGARLVSESIEWGAGRRDGYGTMRVVPCDDERAARDYVAEHGGALMTRTTYEHEWIYGDAEGSGELAA